MTKATAKATKSATRAKKVKSKVQDDDLLIEVTDDELDIQDEQLDRWLQSRDNLGMKLKGELRLEEPADEYAEATDDAEELEDQIEEIEQLADGDDDGFGDDDYAPISEEKAKKTTKKRKDALLDLMPAQPAQEEGAENGYRQLVRVGRSRGWVTIAEINDLLPESALRSEEALTEITLGLGRFGVQVFDQAPDEDTMALLAEQQATVDFWRLRCEERNLW